MSVLTRTAWAIAATATLCIASTGRAQDAPPANAMNPNLSLILDVAAAYYSERDSQQVGAHDPAATGFNLQQLELHADASVDPYFRMDANLVFSLFGVELEEAYATTLGLPAGLQMRIGQFLNRIGRTNPTHPHSWDFANQALVNGKFFGGEGSRGLGVEASWLVPVPWFLETYASVSQAVGECCARSFYGGDDPGVDGVEDFLVTTGMAHFFALSDDWSLRWGTSAQLGPNATGHRNRTTILATDLYLRFRPVDSAHRTALSWQTEFLYRARQVPDDSLRDWGLTTQLVWDVRPEWQFGVRYEHVTGVSNDPLDPEWDDVRHRATAQATFRPSHFSRLRLQGSYDVPDWTPRPIWGGVLAAEFLIGAHGAHGY